MEVITDLIILQANHINNLARKVKVMAAGIYQIKNTVNGKLYIGSAVDIAARWGRHRFDLRKGSHHSKKLQRAWNKYGEKSFVFEVIHSCERWCLLFFEQVFMNAESVVINGYNVEPTAGSSLGRRHSEATKKKISDNNKGKKYVRSAEYCAKLSALKKGKKRAPFSKEWLEKLSASAKGRPKSDEWKAKARARMTPERLSKMHIARMEKRSA